MKVSYYSTIKQVILILLLILININTTYSDIIKKIEVQGNDRLATQTIILFSGLNINDKIDSYDLNNAFKKLYETDYFKDIKINIDNGFISITVKENPIIQNVIINGVKNKTVLTELNKITKRS